MQSIVSNPQANCKCCAHSFQIVNWSFTTLFYASILHQHSTFNSFSVLFSIVGRVNDIKILSIILQQLFVRLDKINYIHGRHLCDNKVNETDELFFLTSFQNILNWNPSFKLFRSIIYIACSVFFLSCKCELDNTNTRCKRKKNVVKCWINVKKERKIQICYYFDAAHSGSFCTSK